MSVKSIVESFVKIDCSVWAAAHPHTNTQTHTHTHSHIHTHTLGSIATYSVEMTEYKKEKKDMSGIKRLLYYATAKYKI